MELYQVILIFLLGVAILSAWEYISWQRWKRRRLKGTKLEKFLQD